MDNNSKIDRGIYALSSDERRELALALIDRVGAPDDAFEAFRKKYPEVPEEMLRTAVFHVYVDGPSAVMDFLADAELAIREQGHELDYGTAYDILYHLFNWLQLRALFPEAKQDLLDLTSDLDELVKSEDWEGVAAAVEELKNIVQGNRTPPDMP